MIRINQLKIPIREWHDDATEKEQLKKLVLKKLPIKEKDIKDVTIVKKSIDARKKQEIKYTYSIDVNIEKEETILAKVKNLDIQKVKSIIYEDLLHQITNEKKKELKQRPVIVGTGPAGLFCGLMLAEAGYRPILIERGGCVEERVKKVHTFWETNQLDLECNVQFGEGGAGTFSDGKLNTLVKDPMGRNRKVLELFVKHGAPEEILYWNKPHIGTDRLREVVKNMREHILSLGGEVRFHTKLTDICVEKNQLQAIVLNEKETMECNVLVLAIGHSARDTFSMLSKRGCIMTPKAFAIGVRVEHLQKSINQAQYGDVFEKLPPADYKLTYQSSGGRAVYSFCMCPGGFVVNSSSEPNRLVVNGMSNYKRDEKNANSAILVTVRPEDFPEQGALGGIAFQRKWEESAYQIGKGNIPIQRFGDFKRNQSSSEFGTITPCIKGAYTFANLQECLPSYVVEALLEAMEAFRTKIKGFSDEDVLLSGVETRTSSPVRIERNESFVSNIQGIYPCGEGAGYAGGITSAAMDGIKVYEAITKEWIE